MTLSDRLFTEATADAEQLARQEAILARYEPPYRPSLYAWHYALTRTAAVLWAGTAIMGFVGLLAVLP